MHDYYSILGITPSANIDTIKQAYRKRALECHPDRGGSNSQMVLVNEAWLILSNPTTRQHYDSARRNVNDKAANRTVQKDAQNVQSKAQDYPKKWDDFQDWLNKNYGSTPLAFGTTLPTGGKNIVRWVFIVTGFISGFFLFSLLSIKLNIHPLVGGSIAMVCGSGGAWLAVSIHYSMYKKQKADTIQKKKTSSTIDDISAQYAIPIVIALLVMCFIFSFYFIDESSETNSLTSYKTKQGTLKKVDERILPPAIYITERLHESKERNYQGK